MLALSPLIHCNTRVVGMEGKMEAETYSAFGCFCKSKTDEKTKAISEEEQTVSDLASEIKKLSSKRDTLDQEIQDLTEEIAEHEHFLATAEEERKKERAIFEASDLDLEKSVHQIDTAVNKLKSSEAFVQGKGAAAAFAGVQASVQTALDMADSLGLIVDAKLPALLQQPVTEVPVADYTFHAGSIIATLEELLRPSATRRSSSRPPRRRPSPTSSGPCSPRPRSSSPRRRTWTQRTRSAR
jgi:outer membrane murein-binding lipoprotein Lpp